MESILHEFINEIKDYISKDKQDDFKKCVEKFEKENNLKLNSVEKPILVKKKKVPEDLEKRLFEITNVEKITFKFNDKSSDIEIIDICDKILNYLDDLEKRNKTYYYTLGELLSILKSRSSNEKEFLTFAKEKFNRSESTINNYIRFYNICNEYSILITCNLSYREIIKNLLK